MHDSKICLSIEATDRYLGISLTTFAGEKLALFYKDVFSKAPSLQSDLLVPTLDKLMRQSHLKRADLTLIAINIGPGSFTGVRVGLASARALAQGLHRPLVGVSSLEIMAWPHSKGNSNVIVPWIPALTSEVYFAAYKSGKIFKSPVWAKEKELENFMKEHPQGHKVSNPPHPHVLAELAVQKYLKAPKSAAFHYENVHPLYLQPSWAERSKRAV